MSSAQKSNFLKKLDSQNKLNLLRTHQEETRKKILRRRNGEKWDATASYIENDYETEKVTLGFWFLGLGLENWLFLWGFNICTFYGLLKLHYVKINECSIPRLLSLYHISLPSPLNHSRSTPHPACIFDE